MSIATKIRAAILSARAADAVGRPATAAAWREALACQAVDALRSGDVAAVAADLGTDAPAFVAAVEIERARYAAACVSF